MKDKLGELVGLPDQRGSWRNGTGGKELVGTVWSQIVKDLIVRVPSFKGESVRKTKSWGGGPQRKGKEIQKGNGGAD